MKKILENIAGKFKALGKIRKKWEMEKTEEPRGENLEIQEIWINRENGEKSGKNRGIWKMANY